MVVVVPVKTFDDVLSRVDGAGDHLVDDVRMLLLGEVLPGDQWQHVPHRHHVAARHPLVRCDLQYVKLKTLLRYKSSKSLQNSTNNPLQLLPQRLIYLKYNLSILTEQTRKIRNIMEREDETIDQMTMTMAITCCIIHRP